MNVPGYESLSVKEKEILHAFLRHQGVHTDAKAIVDGPSHALGIDWCKILRAIRTAARIAACAGNPLCIAEAVAQGLAG